MMKIIISPAKKMKQDRDTLAYDGLPVFLKKTEKLKTYVQSLTYQEAKTLWKCNDRIAKLNFERFAGMELERDLTPALLAYEGIQYQYMAPAVFEDQSLEYVKNHLRILSGFYGVLRPFDGVVPYRLEMQARIQMGRYRNLYDYWGRDICQEVYRETDFVLNLASREYSRCLCEYLTSQDLFLTCRFVELKDGKVVEQGTQVKMARGEMVRFLAGNRVEHREGIKEFQGLGYRYTEEFSDKNTYVFLKEKKDDRHD